MFRIRTIRIRMERLQIVPALHRATHRVNVFLQKRTPQVSQGEAHLLAHLHEHAGEATVAELHRAWAHKRSTLTDMLDRLESRALIRRTPSPDDRRSVRVRATAAGRRLAADVHHELLALERALLSQAGSKAVRAFAAVANAISSGADGARGPDAPKARRTRTTER